MSAMSDSRTVGLYFNVFPAPASRVIIADIILRISTSIARQTIASSKSFARIATSLSSRIVLSSLSCSLTAVDNLEPINRTRAPASSSKSIALSGKKRSAINCEEYFAAATNDSSLYFKKWCFS